MILDRLRTGLEKLGHILGDDLGYFAASLSFYTIFSVIPMLWVLLFVLSKFDAFSVYYLGVKSFLIVNLIPTHTEAVSIYLDEFLENSRKMGLWGFIYVAVASLIFYQNYQYVVNKIFHVANTSFLHALETYLILAVLMPLTLGGSFYFSDYLHRVLGEYDSAIGVFTSLSYLMIWLLFFVIYKVSPNMRISIRVALLSSFVVSVVWQIAKMFFVYYVVINKTYASLYGSFSVMLFFLLWVYLSWFMLLHGLRLCFYLQCRFEN
ncbi:MAG: YihY family inner membrane protein [Gammaproteobacteria bacterium]|nr:YihY family inner membrane protein [Gammaproteobacteria bacterium]